jgi:L-asparaginase
MNIKKNKLPKIAILALGGTIASLADSRVDEFYSAAQLEITDLVSQLPELNALAEIHTEQIAQIISHNITDEIWLELARKTQQLLDQDYDGVVITQGTHSIEETAYFLNLVVKSSKPIILTGAMLPANALGSDALRNLYNVVLLATDPSAHKQGVLLTFNDKIYAARDFSKYQEQGLLGYICGQAIYFYYQIARKHTYCSDFTIKNLARLPKVETIYGCVGSSAMVSKNTQGIISVGMGNGYQSQDVMDTLMSASAQGIVVVRCSRSENMIVTRDPKLDDQYHFIAGDNLSPQKASILLSLALSATNDFETIQQIFNKY